MKQRLEQVGFSQRVRLEWFELAAAHAMAGSTAEDLSGSLRELLRGKVSVGRDAERGNREKIITIARRTWLPSDDGRENLRQRAFGLLRSLPREQHIVVHWGMVMAVYPFWNAVADAVGRLLRLQSTMAISQVQRRLCEKYGERETVARSARRIIRSFVDWSVLAEGETKGSYRAGKTVNLERLDLTAWLIEASLHSVPGGRIPLSTATNSPGLFAFAIPPISCEQVVSLASGVDVMRHGLDQNLLMLRH